VPQARRASYRPGSIGSASAAHGGRAEFAPEATLPLATTAHAALDPIAAILSFYVMAAGLAAARGRNPDAPRHLNKVTETH